MLIQISHKADIDKFSSNSNSYNKTVSMAIYGIKTPNIIKQPELLTMSVPINNFQLADPELNKGKQVATADLEKVKGDTINALKQLQGSVLNSLTETETYALGQCLNRCKTAAKAMIAAHDSSIQANSMGANSMGGRKKRKTKKRKHRKGTKKYRR
jgi:hypothetical protein